MPSTDKTELAIKCLCDYFFLRRNNHEFIFILYTCQNESAIRVRGIYFHLSFEERTLNSFCCNPHDSHAKYCRKI